jgi:6,7-dimethyl-8-ribityllumazine synthase
MASGDERARIPDGISGASLRIGIIRARWNAAIVDRLAEGVNRGLDGLRVSRRVEHSVPGCFELPLAAKLLARTGTVDAVVCIGAVVRGETTHYEIVSGECARGIQQAQLDTGIPVLFGVLTVEDQAQAEARSQPAGGHNVGQEAAEGAVEMALLARQLVPSPRWEAAGGMT